MKLVVHIGHGKTGSSSIQESLLAASPRLAEQGVKYLGLMLEHAETPERRVWQIKGGSDIFFDGLVPDTAMAELSDVLTGEMSLLVTKGYKQAIWSNEWILQRPAQVLPVLRDLQVPGVEIEIQAYIRRHDKWAISAYTQWGLRHKSYQGPLLDFDTWIARFKHHAPQFIPAIMPWREAFASRLRLMNFDSAGDVVQHFMRVNGISDVATISENVSPDAVAMACSAVYNGSKNGTVPPSDFEQVKALADQWDQNGGYLATLDRLFPSPEALAALRHDCADDIAQVNALLVASGEPELSFDPLPKPMRHPSAWEMEQQMLKLIFALTEEVGTMRAQIAALKQQLAATSAARQT